MDVSKTAVTGSDEPSAVRAALDMAVWGVPLAATLGAVSLLVVLFFDTFESIVSIWWRSETFAHGFLILPIALYLVWDERAGLRGLAPVPEFRVLPLLAMIGFGWLACRLAGVLVLEQYFAVASIPVAVWAVLGNVVMRQLAFPLGFLLLGVPVGEFLIPPLIDFTAWFTVAGLRLTGVAVLRDGNLLTLAGSQWSVVEACSGLRYLIACVTLGLLYAHLTYRSWWRRGLCVLASVIVPIIANGFRAYMIVMMGHLSNMKLAVGVDHLIYGWVFFGVVIFIFFWVGSFFREDNVARPERVPAGSPSPLVARSRFLVAGVAVVLVAALWPAWAARADNDAVELAQSPALPDAVGGWAAVPLPPMGWQPHYVGADVTGGRVYERDGEHVGLHLACYAAQRQGSELVSSSNTLVSPDDSSRRQLETEERVVALETGALDVMESVLDSRGSRLRVWQWYWIGGVSTVSPYYAKLLELSGKLSARPPLACGVVAYTAEGPAAASRMEAFLTRAVSDVETSLAALGRDR
jgi:exosortase A